MTANLGEIGKIDSLGFNWNGVYADGALETLLGDDRVSFTVDQDSVVDGIHTAWTGKGEKVMVFLWGGHSDWNKRRGLCVLQNNEEDVSFAERKYNERADFL